MHTRHPAPEITEERLDWLTYDIEPDGTQICAIRPARRCNDGVVLDRRASQLLQVLLTRSRRTTQSHSRKRVRPC